mgnify:FL=1
MKLMKFFLFGLIFVSILGGCVKKGPASTYRKILPVTQQKTSTKIEDRDVIKRFPATLIRIVDGDTLEVSLENTSEKIRLLGINSPETVDSNKPVECFGHEAAEYIKSLMPGKNIFLQKDKFAPDRDQYGRLLRYVYNGNNAFINLEMVKNGYAFAYTPGSLEHFSDFRYYEKQARDENRGLWNTKICPYKAKYGG